MKKENGFYFPIENQFTSVIQPLYHPERKREDMLIPLCGTGHRQ